MSKLEDQLAMQFDLAVRAGKIPPYVREWIGLPGCKFRFDFAWPKYGLALEVQGGIYHQQRLGHTSISGMHRDCEKHSLAAINRIYLIVCAPEHIRTGKTLHWVMEFFKGVNWKEKT